MSGVLGQMQGAAPSSGVQDYLDWRNQAHADNAATGMPGSAANASNAQDWHQMLMQMLSQYGQNGMVTGGPALPNLPSMAPGGQGGGPMGAPGGAMPAPPQPFIPPGTIGVTPDQLQAQSNTMQAGGWDTGPGPSQDLQAALIQMFQAGQGGQGGQRGGNAMPIPSKQQFTDWATQQGAQQLLNMDQDRNSATGASGGRG